MDLFRVCQFWSVIGFICDDRCLKTMSVFFEIVFSYEGSWGWYIGGALLEGGGTVGSVGNGISIEV